MRNRRFCGARRPRNAPKGSSEGGPKTDPEKYTKKTLFGGPFWNIFGYLGASWAYLGALCCYLVASWPQRPTKGGPSEAKRGSRGAQGSPREAQERPRGSQKCSGEPKRGPREPQTVSREFPRVQREPKTGQESPKERPREPKRAQDSDRTTFAERGVWGDPSPQLFISRAKVAVLFKPFEAFLEPSPPSSPAFATFLALSLPCLLLCFTALCRVLCSALPRRASLHFSSLYFLCFSAFFWLCCFFGFFASLLRYILVAVLFAVLYLLLCCIFCCI